MQQCSAQKSTPGPEVRPIISGVPTQTCPPHSHLLLLHALSADQEQQRTLGEPIRRAGSPTWHLVLCWTHALSLL